MSVPSAQAPGAAPADRGVAGSSGTAVSSGTGASAPGSALDPQITSVLTNLFDNESNYAVDLSNVQGTPEGDLLSVGSPMGFALRNYYFNPGIPMARAFAMASFDPAFRRKLRIAAQFGQSLQTRSAAMLILASRHDVKDKPIFERAVGFMEPSIRFAAMESLVIWGHPDIAIPMLQDRLSSENMPILQVYAAAMLARLGDSGGLDSLRQTLSGSGASWVAQAMAARYLGDYGSAQDYDTMINMIGQAQQNDFLSAEYCLSALKLFPKKLAQSKQNL